MPSSKRVSDMVALIKPVGFEYVGQKRHNKWRHPETGNIVVFPTTPGSNPPVHKSTVSQVKTLVREHEQYRPRRDRNGWKKEEPIIGYQVKPGAIVEPEPRGEDMSTAKKPYAPTRLLKRLERAGISQAKFTQMYYSLSNYDCQRELGIGSGAVGRLAAHFGLNSKAKGGRIRRGQPAVEAAPPQPTEVPLLEAACALEEAGKALQQAFTKLADVVLRLEQDEERITNQVVRRVVARLTGEAQ